MATGTVADERKERKRELETARKELDAAMAKYAAAEVAASSEDGAKRHPALVDQRMRRTAVSSCRSALEAAYRADRSDGNALACAECGGPMRHAGRGESPVETVPGRVRLSMARHACRVCRTTVRPRARALDIEGSMTPAARRMASLAGSSCCHEEADRLPEELAGVNFGPKRIERTTRLVGDDAESRREAALSGALPVVSGDAAEWRREAALPGALTMASEGGGGEAPARKPLQDGEVLCVALDGTGVPARPSETVGRAGKDGGRAGTREAKVGAPWVLEPDGEGGMRTAEGSVRYFAGVESTTDDDVPSPATGGDSPVARRLLRELAAAGHAPGDVGVCIGDGAAWLRRLFEEWFPDAVSIIDFNAAAGGAHASEYVWAAAGARYGPGTGPARHWATRQCRLLKAGRADEVLAALRKAGGGECAKAARYIAERRDRMRYDEYLARSLPIGSGRVEAGEQDRRRTAPEVHRHALDGGRREPGAVGALRAAERLVRRLLG